MLGVKAENQSPVWLCSQDQLSLLLGTVLAARVLTVAALRMQVASHPTLSPLGKTCHLLLVNFPLTFTLHCPEPERAGQQITVCDWVNLHSELRGKKVYRKV